MIKDYFKLAWENITNRKLRSWLTILGIVIGIASVVALVSLGQGVKQVVTEQFEMMGTDKILIQPAGSGGGISYSGSQLLTEHDMDIVKKVKGVKGVMGYYYIFVKVEFNDELFYESFAVSMPMDESRKILEDMNAYKIVSGRNLKPGDRYKCVVGYSLANTKVFKKPVSVGDKIKIDNKTFEVVGTLDLIGNPYDDASILITQDTMEDVYQTKDKMMIIVQTDSGINPEPVAKEIEKELRRDKNQKEGEEDFEVQTTAQYFESFSVILDVVTGIVIGIAAISLIVGGVGITNTMYTAVLERTNEIGVMKAIGARNSHILKLFLIESGMIGLMGGALGITIGIGLSKIIQYIGQHVMNVPYLKATFPWYLIVGALAFAFIVGMISGALPAKQAAEMNPVDALRYE